MTDKELLELAAKAAGCKSEEDGTEPYGLYVGEASIYYETFNDGWRYWRPLDDDGDALRLAVKLGMILDLQNEVLFLTRVDAETLQINFDSDHDYLRAIVRAAAEIGKGMK